MNAVRCGYTPGEVSWVLYDRILLRQHDVGQQGYLGVDPRRAVDGANDRDLDVQKVR